MAAIAAAQIVTELAARVDAWPDLAAPVQTMREDSAAATALPAAWLWAGDEDAEAATLDGGIHEVRLQVVLRLIVAADGTDGIDDAMNAAAGDVMPLLFAPPLVHDLEWAATRREAATRGGVRCGVITIIARATYHVDPAAPDVFL